MRNKNLFDSFKYAIGGILYSLKNERNMRIHGVLAVICVLMGLYFKISQIEWLVVFIAITLVIVTEMINTAIERTIDMVKDEYHPLAKISKDVAAGAVLISAVNALIVGYIVFFDNIMDFLRSLGL